MLHFFHLNMYMYVHFIPLPIEIIWVRCWDNLPQVKKLNRFRYCFCVSRISTKWNALNTTLFIVIYPKNKNGTKKKIKSKQCANTRLYMPIKMHRPNAQGKKTGKFWWLPFMQFFFVVWLIFVFVHDTEIQVHRKQCTNEQIWMRKKPTTIWYSYRSY